MKKFLCAFLLSAIAGAGTGLQAQNKMYGMTNLGGEGNAGLIYRSNSDGSNPEVAYLFEVDEGGQVTGAPLEVDGKLYGTWTKSNVSSIYSYDISAKQYEILGELGYVAGSLMKASDGHIYGATLRGYTNNEGAIFQYDIENSLLSIKTELTDIGAGGNWYGSLIEINEKLYGVSTDNKLFEYDLVSEEIVHKINLPGAFSLYGIKEGSDGNMYGVTLGGGSQNNGLLYTYDPIENIATTLFEFTGTEGAHIGAYAQGFVISGDVIYGVTEGGGDNGKGSIYQYDYINDIFTSLHSFDGSDGWQGIHIFIASNGKLYGSTLAGGENNYGLLFEYDLINDLFTIRKHYQYGNTGGKPEGEGIIQGTDDKLYGTLTNGSGDGIEAGTLYAYDIANDQFEVLIAFGSSIKGHNPAAYMTLGTNGLLYGTTQKGGIGNHGILFSYDPETENYAKLEDFASISGNNAQGGLIEVNGSFYGTTYSGGDNESGILFKYESGGGTLVKLIDFSVTSADGGDSEAKGSQPLGGLTKASNGKLYGLTFSGGDHGHGLVYMIDPSNDSYTRYFPFYGPASGKNPIGELVEGNNGLLYGLTFETDNPSSSALFSFDPSTNQVERLHTLSGNMGYNPHAGLTKAFNGKLYGVTTKGGTGSVGTLIEFDPYTNTLTKKVDFTGSNGDRPMGKLTLSSNGNLYGVTQRGGADELGVRFEYNPYDDVYTVLDSFDGTNGASPVRNGMVEVFETNTPVVTKQPGASVNVCQGETLELMVFASGSNITYQWKKGSENIAGANSSYFRIENVSESQDGNYSCVVTNSHGSVTSETTSVSIPIIPILTLEEISTKTYGDPSFALDFTTEGANNLNFTSSNLEVATITEGTVTIVGGGTATITGTLSNSCFTTTAEQTLVVKKATHEVTFAAIPEATYGGADITLSASSSAGVPVTFSSSDENVVTISGNTLTVVGGGEVTITASSENSNYGLVTSTQTLSVKKADQTITFEELEDKTFGDDSFELVASAGAEVSFTSSDENIVTISGSTATIVGAGTVEITASQAGNSNYNAASDVLQTLTVNKADQTITFEELTEVIGVLSYDLVASASSGLEVTYTSSNTDVATIEESRLHVHDLGEVVITAHQVGNSNYNSASEQQTLTISKVLEVSVTTQATIFPNPASHSLEVSGMTHGASNFTVYDLQGQVRYNQTLKSEKQISIDISTYPVGMYLLKISSGKKVDIHKFYKSEKSN